MPSPKTIVRIENITGSQNTGCGLACGVVFFGIFGALGAAGTLAVLAAPGAVKLLALFPLIFVAVGFGGIWAILRGGGQSPERALAARNRSAGVDRVQTQLPVPTLLTYMGRGLPVRLSTQTSQRAAVGGLVFVTLFWNGIVSVFVVVGLTTDEFPFWVWIFLTPFMLIGAGIFAALVKQVLIALKVPDTVVELDKEPACPGETVRILVSQRGNLRFDSIRVEVTCEEKISYTRGTDTYREDRKLWTETLLQSPAFQCTPNRPWSKNLEFTIPANAMHSFHAPHNEIVWKLVVKGTVSRWPDFEFTFPFRVMPVAARANISWKRESLSR